MKKFKDNKGITLTTLIVTVVVLTIIAGTATYTGMEVYQEAKEEAFIQELKIIQNAVNNEWSKIELASLNDGNNDGAIDDIYDTTWGNESYNIPVDVLSSLNDIIGEGNGFRYYTADRLKEIGINGVNSTVLINFTTREVISVNGFNGKHSLKEFNETTNYGNVAIEIDDVPIPNGFVYLTGNKSDGLVIKNVKDGNEFVWVPVEDINDIAVLQGENYVGQLWATALVNNFGNKNQNYTKSNGLREIDVLKGVSSVTGKSLDENSINIEAILEKEKYENNIQGLNNQFQDEFNNMVKSVKKYGGFYVGRYELSWDGNKVKSVKTGSTAEILMASTNLGENWITSNENHIATWYGLYKKQKELYDIDTDYSVVSGMIYGCQWDAIMNWMREDKNISSYVTNSLSVGNYNSTSYINTGSENAYKLKNIYDLAGNYFEYTQEAYTDKNRVARGGSYTSYGSGYQISGRASDTPDASRGYSSRLQLYIKVD